MSYYQTIYNRLRVAGLTEAGALGCLGNWECESNCEPGRVQGDFSSFRSISKAYVQSITTFALSRDAFARDQKGFGLAQWTYYTRKQELYDYWRSSNLAIDSVDLQVAFALKEFQRDFAADLAILKKTNDIYEACKVVCVRFENPLHHNIDARFRAATKIKYEIDLNGFSAPVYNNVEPVAQKPSETTTVTKPDDGWEKIPAAPYWPPRGMKGGRDDPGLCKGMNGYDVMVVQSILKSRGYAVTTVDGDFGTYLESIVKLFQENFGLTADGIIGPMTWKALLEF